MWFGYRLVIHNSKSGSSRELDPPGENITGCYFNNGSPFFCIGGGLFDRHLVEQVRRPTDLIYNKKYITHIA